MTTLTKQQEHDVKIRAAGFRAGAQAAAIVASGYRTNHPYRIDDCILGKLNLRGGRPRRNRQQLEDPDEVFLTGIGAACASMLRLKWPPKLVCEVLRTHHVSVDALKKTGLNGADLRLLRRHAQRW